MSGSNLRWLRTLGAARLLMHAKWYPQSARYPGSGFIQELKPKSKRRDWMNKVVTWIAVIHVFLSTLFEVNVSAATEVYNPEHIYGMLAIVTEVNPNEDLVSVTNRSGEVYSFYGIDYWWVGDYAILIMHDNYTEDFDLDDIILSVQYEFIDRVESFNPLRI